MNIKNNTNTDKQKIMLIKTNIGCFISDCNAISGYDYNYHNCQIKDWYFDGKKPDSTFYRNWLRIDKYPEKIEKLCHGEYINKRYVIEDDKNITPNLPQIIPYENRNEYNESVLESIYKYEYDQAPDYFKDVDVEIEVLFETDDLTEAPIINYKAVRKNGFSEELYTITNANVEHQLFDKMIYPEIMLHEKPCKLTSKQMYDITRQYIKDNIEKDKARITSDYAFCFEVRKIIPLLEPQQVSYQNIFARTKKERNKIHYKTLSTKEVTIFSMAHNQENYRGYTAIDELYAKNEKELKEKLDEWLNTLMNIINQPLYQCPYCNGSGYQSETISINKHDVIEKINNK